MKKKIWIGTSGWSYKHWREIFYPVGMKPVDYLPFYSNHYFVTEINTSFYHLPKPETVTGWIEKVPKGFMFCPKISRYITHIKRLKDPEDTLPRFFEVFEPVKKHLGPILIQLPPSSKFHYDIADHFFSVLKKEYKGYDFALEVRHDTWLEEDSLSLMTKYNIAFVISQSGDRFPYSEMVTAKNIYVRFHGPEGLYSSSYSTKMLKMFAKKFAGWIDSGHVIWAFFNNDIGGHALTDSKRLIEMMEIQ
ncbi:MAG: hypothetical protein JWN76_3098 [Chitinophagaceae bacterium]|nr:hypothetical protein [Chitinophagaceae bacterium]